MVDPIEPPTRGVTSDGQKPQQEGSPAFVIAAMVLLMVLLIVWYRFK